MRCALFVVFLPNILSKPLGVSVGISILPRRLLRLLLQPIIASPQQPVLAVQLSDQHVKVLFVGCHSFITVTSCGCFFPANISWMRRSVSRCALIMVRAGSASSRSL